MLETEDLEVQEVPNNTSPVSTVDKHIGHLCIFLGVVVLINFINLQNCNFRFLNFLITNTIIFIICMIVLVYKKVSNSVIGDFLAIYLIIMFLVLFFCLMYVLFTLQSCNQTPTPSPTFKPTCNHTD